MLGNLGKPVTIETSGVMKFVKWVFRNLEPAKPRSRELAKIWILEPAKFKSREPVKIWSHEPATFKSRGPVKIWSLEPAKLLRSRSYEDPESWTCEVLESWTCETQNRESLKFGNLLKSKFGGYGVWRFPWIRDSWISKKPSQRRYLKSSGLTCELVVGL